MLVAYMVIKSSLNIA